MVDLLQYTLEMAKKKEENSLNKFINLANSVVTCGPSCQRQKKIDELKNKYETAKSNYDNGEQIVNNAEKAYLVYANGDVYYYNMLRQRNEKIAKENIDKKEKNYIEKIDELKAKDNELNILKKNKKKLNEYNNLLKKKYDEIINKIEDFNKVVYTSDRKAYYENEELNSIKSKNNTYFIIYFVIFSILCIYILLIKKDYNKLVIIKLSIYLLIPFIGLYILDIIVKFINYILDFLPNNVYKQIIMLNEKDKISEEGLLKSVLF